MQVTLRKPACQKINASKSDGQIMTSSVSPKPCKFHTPCRTSDKKRSQGMPSLMPGPGHRRLVDVHHSAAVVGYWEHQAALEVLTG